MGIEYGMGRITIMKRIILICLCLVVLFSFINSCLAEDFSIRGGIHFGMTIDEVKKCERANGLPDSSIYFINDSYGVIDKYYCIGYETEIAGIYGSRLLYYFDLDTKKLREIKYELGSKYQSEQTATSYFTDISKSLNSKYGLPNYSSVLYSGSLYLIQTQNFYEAIFWSIDSSDVAFHEWLIDYGDYYVLIDSTYYESAANSYVTGVGYRYVTKEEEEKAIQDKTQRENDKKQKQNNDL